MPKAKAAAKAAKKTKVNPFKTKKTRTVESPANDTVTPPASIAQAIDAFREAQDQAKHFEGEATVHKDAIIRYSQQEYSKRVMNGVKASFKILGEETMVTYIVQDSSAGLTEEEVSDFVQKWGEDAADQLIVRDFASIRFDGKVLEANYDAVVAALQTLPEEVLEKLFKPMLMKATSGAVEAAKRHVRSADEMKEILKDLKLKNYIR